MVTQADKERIASNIHALTLGSIKGIKAVPSIIMRAGFDDADALAYSYGDIVKHNDKLWISTVKGKKTNVWEPGVYGWDEYVAA